ncbi:hypothetical protein [Desulfonema magnum]|uniref:Uncharacterized protein n=1 Tax=Desulfonema magnum TaxID=45655 RepID=A0A975GUA0_9BACT|nr:hypothetical protein [Desulfonema magnum]QTA93945.1 Uncharacterized protein dnm_100540 [Desulfonema magnum]
MVTENLLSELFRKRIEKLAIEKHLTDAEKERIIRVFKEAMTNRFMDAHQICQQLGSEDTV